MNPKHLPGGLLIVALLVILSYHFCDNRLAQFMEYLWKTGLQRSGDTIRIPDTLLPLAGSVTLTGSLLWLYYTRTGPCSREKRFFRLLSINVPTAFLGKLAFKHLFGRANPRFWIEHPGVHGFHWFQGGGTYDSFPSGHMAVFTAMILPLWRFYPRYRPLYLSFLLLLGSALVITNYHFLSDVLAGAYLGLAVDCVVHWNLTAAHAPTQS